MTTERTLPEMIENATDWIFGVDLLVLPWSMRDHIPAALKSLLDEWGLPHACNQRLPGGYGAAVSRGRVVWHFKIG